MTEQQLLEHVLARAAELKILVYHHPDSRRALGNRGFPDLVLLGRSGLMFAELKSATGALSPGQTWWRYLLISCGINYRIWRPQDWANGKIESCLQWIA